MSQAKEFKDILSLALCAPVSYRDYRIKNYIDKDTPLLEVKITSIEQLQKIIKVKAYAKNIHQEVELIFFKMLPYHYETFKVGNELFVTGRVEFHHGKLQLLQPKRVANYKIGKIFAEYKVGIRGDIFEKIKKEYLTLEGLLKEGIPLKRASALMKIHFPDEKFYREFRKRGGFFGEYLEALKFLEAFSYLRALQKKRKFLPSLCQWARDIEPFYRTLPFTLTSDQKRAIEDIQKDLKKEVAAKRVVVGDVGSGKSVVMFATAFITYPKRAILMAPTTILATQLFNEAKRLLPKYIKIALVNSKTKEESLDEYHFIIGTHALLYRELPEACVVMVDEQHRFGTEQREKLKQLQKKGKKAPHYIQFSATPIPRTKALMDSALVDFSFIKEIPFKKDIDTFIVDRSDFKTILAHIKSELAKGHQILIVYPLIEESQNYNYKSLEEAQEFWQRYFDGVYITHGKDSQKDEVLKEFREKGRILLATTVIEVGISLPKLSTIIIVGAENLGLATLHQLRGRVSRTGLKGYCFLYTNDKNNRRLQEFCKISSGFEVAELDLAFRKSGDILSGKEQSGKSFQWLEMTKDGVIIEEVKMFLS